MNYPLICAFALLAGCASTDFVMDARPVALLDASPANQAAAKLELPARIGLVREVDNRPRAAGPDEQALWENLIDQADHMGQFVPLSLEYHAHRTLRKTAADLRLNYLLVLSYDLRQGTAAAQFVDVATGAVFARSEITDTPRTGFWGGRINNPTRVERITDGMSRALAPEVANMLNGLTARGL